MDDIQEKMDDIQEKWMIYKKIEKRQWCNRVFCHQNDDQNDARVTNINYQFLNVFDLLIGHVWWNLFIILKKMHTDN